jgi:hypothetical protein
MDRKLFIVAESVDCLLIEEARMVNRAVLDDLKQRVIFIDDIGIIDVY